MKKLAVVIGVSLLASLLYLGCGGGGSDESAVGNLQGTWLGWIEDDTGKVQEFSLQIDGAGNIIEVQIAGKPTGDTGQIVDDWDENLFHVNYNASSILGGGVLIVDPQYSHATYGDHGSTGSSDYYCGVLQRGAPNLPAHAASEIIDSYPLGGAYAFTYDSSLGYYNWVGDEITMTVDQNLAFSGSIASEGPFEGGFDEQLFNPSYGRYAGTFTRTVPQITMDITAYISPDGSAIGACAKRMDTDPKSLYDFILIGLKK